MKGDLNRSEKGKRDYGTRDSVRSTISDVSLPRLSELASEPLPEEEADIEHDTSPEIVLPRQSAIVLPQSDEITVLPNA